MLLCISHLTFRHFYRQKISALTGAEDALDLRGGYSPRRTNENSVTLYASEQKTGSYLATMAGFRAFDQFYGRVSAQHISPLYGAHLPLKKEIEMKKVLMFAVALMFPAFAIAESLSSSELNDAQIIHTTVTANQVFIENSELAGKKARNKNVHAFARRIITESTDVNKQAKGLAAKLNVTPEDNAISKSLKADGKKSLDQLKNLSGSEFDKAYIDAAQISSPQPTCMTIIPCLICCMVMSSVFMVIAPMPVRRI